MKTLLILSLILIAAQAQAKCELTEGLDSGTESTATKAQVKACLSDAKFLKQYHVWTCDAAKESDKENFGGYSNNDSEFVDAVITVKQSKGVIVRTEVYKKVGMTLTLTIPSVLDDSSKLRGVVISDDDGKKTSTEVVCDFEGGLVVKGKDL